MAAQPRIPAGKGQGRATFPLGGLHPWPLFPAAQRPPSHHRAPLDGQETAGFAESNFRVCNVLPRNTGQCRPPGPREAPRLKLSNPQGFPSSAEEANTDLACTGAALSCRPKGFRNAGVS